MVNIRGVACRLRRYPQAGDNTDKDDDYVPELEAPMDAAGPSVASSAQSQSDKFVVRVVNHSANCPERGVRVGEGPNIDCLGPSGLGSEVQTRA